MKKIEKIIKIITDSLKNDLDQWNLFGESELRFKNVSLKILDSRLYLSNRSRNIPLDEINEYLLLDLATQAIEQKHQENLRDLGLISDDIEIDIEIPVDNTEVEKDLDDLLSKYGI